MTRRCFFCSSEIAENEPQLNLFSYHLCPKCAEAMNEGITLISVEYEPVFAHQEPIATMEDGKKFYPTGEWIVLPEEMVIKLFKDENASTFIRLKKGFLLSELFDTMKETFDQIKLKNEENV